MQIWLVTSGAGFISGNPNYAFIRGDIRARALVAKLLVGYRPDAVVNFSENHVSRSVDIPAVFIEDNTGRGIRFSGLTCSNSGG